MNFNDQVKMNGKIKNHERNWIVINPMEKRTLIVGDVLKLGRVRLKIDRIYTRKYVEDSASKILNENYSYNNIRIQPDYSNLKSKENKDKNMTSSK
jgi:hypothetical protein